MTNIKLAIAEDHPVFRKGLATEIHEVDDFNLIIVAQNGKELIKMIKTQKPDVILMDLRMPEMDGIDASLHVKRHYPNIKIIVLTMYYSEFTIATLMKMGVNGYLTKNESFKEIKKAIYAVMEEGFYYNNYASKAMQDGLSGMNKMKLGFDYVFNLTKIEHRVLKLICQGYTTTEIARKVCLSARTIESYRYNLLDKMEVRNTASLVKRAIENNLVNLDLRLKDPVEN